MASGHLRSAARKWSTMNKAEAYLASLEVDVSWLGLPAGIECRRELFRKAYEHLPSIPERAPTLAQLWSAHRSNYTAVVTLVGHVGPRRAEFDHAAFVKAVSARCSSYLALDTRSCTAEEVSVHSGRQSLRVYEGCELSKHAVSLVAVRVGRVRDAEEFRAPYYRSAFTAYGFLVKPNSYGVLCCIAAAHRTRPWRGPEADDPRAALALLESCTGRSP